MTFFILFLVISSIFHNTFATSATNKSAKKAKRSNLSFSDDTKWECFYLTTTPVKGLDEAIWRQDEYGNLLMAGLSYCKGCICYNFDHRFPISEIPDDKITNEIALKMHSVDNCQAMSVRVNSLKGSSQLSDIEGVIGRFGCDSETMRLFSANDYAGAREIQRMLMDQDRFEHIQRIYGAFKNKENSREQKRNYKTPGDCFDERRHAADSLAEEVKELLAPK